MRIDEIKSLKTDFDSNLNEQFSSEKIEELFSVKNEIETKSRELKEKIDPKIVFFKELNNEMNWIKFQELYKQRDQSKLNIETDYEMFRIAFGNFVPYGELRNEGYRHFLEDLSSDPSVIQKIYDLHKHRFLAENTIAQAYINSLFLNKFMKEDTVLTVDYEIPEPLGHNFAMLLERGTINLDNAPSGTGKYQRGGKINVTRSLGDLGHNAMGGRISVSINNDPAPCYCANNSILKTKELDRVGRSAENIIVFTDRAGDHFGDMPKGGVLIANSAGRHVGGTGDTTVLVEKNESYSSTYAVCYRYSSENNTYRQIAIDSMGTCSGEIGTIDSVVGYRDLINGRTKLGIIEDPEQFSENITDGLKTGILVLKKTPKFNIGKGMGQAVVIIEDPDITPDEAKTRISKENRSGGLILMRIPDPTEDNPNNSKLIDLEDDWLEKMEANGGKNEK